ncbi:winged helix-turn-helix domain-containing protein [Steroidobacter sp.]|uniref:winged helix-turn-helix domain-containing protein n=1 Tax=Steroidobacter sp. TaxID=1978227 RepID=UPI0039F457C4
MDSGASPTSACARTRGSNCAVMTRGRTHRRKRRRREGKRRFLSAWELRTVARSLKGPPREVGIAGARWSVARIHRFLRKRFGIKLSPRYSVRRLRQAKIRIKLTRAREPRLSPRALAELRRALRRPPSAFGLAGDRWSRHRIALLIERRFKRRFTPAYAGRVARRLRGHGLGPSTERRLTLAQAHLLQQMLLGPPPPDHAALTRRDVALLIERRFGVRYHSQSIPALLRRWKITYICSPAPVGDPRPNTEQLNALARALKSPPALSGIAAPRWNQRTIASWLDQHSALRYPIRGLYRRLNRWGVFPNRAAVGGACALTLHQREEVKKVMAAPPRQCGYCARRWSRASVARLILDRFGICYSPASIPHLLRSLGVSLRAVRSVPNARASSPASGAHQLTATDVSHPPRPRLPHPRPASSHLASAGACCSRRVSRRAS